MYHLSNNPNYFSTVGCRFLTTGEDFPEKITDGDPRPKTTSIDEPELAGSLLIRAGGRFGSSRETPFARGSIATIRCEPQAVISISGRCGVKLWGGAQIYTRDTVSSSPGLGVLCGFSL